MICFIVISQQVFQPCPTGAHSIGKRVESMWANWMPYDLCPGGDFDDLYPDVCVECLKKDPI